MSVPAHGTANVFLNAHVGYYWGRPTVHSCVLWCIFL